MTDQQYQNPSEPRWEQPDFDHAAQAPVYSGQVLQPGQAPRDLAGPGLEEQRWRQWRRLVFPLALVVAILTGAWWPALAAAIVVTIVIRHRIRQLRWQRLSAAGFGGSAGPIGYSDLR